MTIDTRVGFMTTSILEEELREYVTAHTTNGEYTGAPWVLSALENIIEYNNEVNE